MHPVSVVTNRHEFWVLLLASIQMGLTILLRIYPCNQASDCMHGKNIGALALSLSRVPGAAPGMRSVKFITHYL